MNIIKTISTFMLAIHFVFLSSCSTKAPHLDNPTHGIIALPYYASNTSRLNFYRYYKIYPSTNPEIYIEIYPHRGHNFAYSKELPPGNYNFDKISILLNSSVARSAVHTGIEEIKGGISVEVKPGSITPTDKKLYIEQYNMQDATYVNANIHFQSIPEADMNKLRLKFNNN